MASRLLPLILGLSLAPMVTAEDWIAALQRRVKAMDEMFQAPEAPEIAQTDLYGKRFTLHGLEGRVVVLSFLDRESVAEAIQWLERQTTWLLHQQGVTFVNVFHPGGISFMIPRGEVVHRIRKEVDQSHRRFEAKLHPDDRALLDRADIRWVVDWDRSHAAKYPVEAGRVNLFLVDEQSRIREVLRYDPQGGLPPPGDDGAGGWVCSRPLVGTRSSRSSGTQAATRAPSRRGRRASTAPSSCAS